MLAGRGLGHLSQEQAALVRTPGPCTRLRTTCNLCLDVHNTVCAACVQDLPSTPKPCCDSSNQLKSPGAV